MVVEMLIDMDLGAGLHVSWLCTDVVPATEWRWRVSLRCLQSAAASYHRFLWEVWLRACCQFSWYFTRNIVKLLRSSQEGYLHRVFCIRMINSNLNCIAIDYPVSEFIFLYYVRCIPQNQCIPLRLSVCEDFCDPRLMQSRWDIAASFFILPKVISRMSALLQWMLGHWRLVLVSTTWSPLDLLIQSSFSNLLAVPTMIFSDCDAVSFSVSMPSVCNTLPDNLRDQTLCWHF